MPLAATGSCTAAFAEAGNTYTVTFGYEASNIDGIPTGLDYVVLLRDAQMVITGSVAPAPVITGLAANVGLSADSVTVDFGEPVTGFTLGDLALSNLAAANLQTSDNTVFTFDVTASGDGIGSISIPAGAAQSVVGVDNTPAAQVTTNADSTPPEAELVRIDYISASDIYLATFRVPTGTAYGPNVGLTQLVNATNQGIRPGPIVGAPGEFMTRFVPTQTGTVTLTFVAGYFVDDAGNLSEEQMFDMGTYDTTPPTVSISGSQGFPGDPYQIDITFSEPVNGFVVGDITGTNATVSDFVNSCGTDPCATFSAVVTANPSSEFSHSVQVLAGVAQDAAGNDNLASAVAAPPPPDGMAPVVTITGVPDGFTGPVTATVTFDWGEEVLGFEDTDISVTGGTLGPITGGRQSWTAQLSVNGDVNVMVSVAGGAVLDSSGMASAAASVTGEFASGALAEEIIREFLGARSLALIAAQPSLGGLLDNDGPTGNIQVSRGQGVVQMRTGTEGPIWAAVDAQWSELDGFETAYTHLTFGSHLYLQDETLLGVMVQFDHAASSEGVAEIEGTGWLVGPYYVARYGGVVMDARLLWGRTENEISPLGTYTDTFATERVLAMVNLSGEVVMERVTLRPLFGWSYVEDRSEGYTDALSNPVAAQRVRLGQVEAAVDWTMPLGDEGLEFVGGVAGLFTAEDGGNGEPEGARGRVDLGLRRQNAGPFSFDVGVFYEGLGQSNYESYGLDLTMDWRF